jgi:predicted TIM-barrel enzyme
MADPKDVETTKIVRREFNRRAIDTSMADIRVSHGVVYVRGTVKAMRGGSGDPRGEVELIARALRTRPEVRDVVIDCTFRS